MNQTSNRSGSSDGAEGRAARRAALSLLLGVVVRGESLGDQAPKGLEPSERARAERMAREVLRNVAAIDGVIAPFLEKKPREPALSALRMAAWEMVWDGVPDHAAVNGAVDAVRKAPGGARAAKLVNAVARRVAEVAGERRHPRPNRLPAGLRKPMVAAYGTRVVEGMERVHGKGAPLDLTVKPGEDVAALATELGGEELPGGSIRLQEAGQVSALAGFEAGRWWVQDWAAALPVRALGDLAGLKALDLCAAPGGKTMQLAAAGADVTAVDISERRSKRVRENLTRTGLTAEIVAADVLDWAPEVPADVVLLDAPCSATGTIRRHPDLPILRAKGIDPELPGLQAALLARASEWVKPGGRLVFATCSLLPEEGEAHLDAAPGLGLEAEAIEVPGLEDAWRVPGGVRLRPDYWADRGGMDGFFVALFRKV